MTQRLGVPNLGYRPGIRWFLLKIWVSQVSQRYPRYIFKPGIRKSVGT